MIMQSFYSCYSTGDHVPSTKPIELEKDTAIDVAMQILKEPNDFIGFVDQSGTTIQLYYDESEKIWVEIPYPEKRGSYGMHISISEVELFVKGLPSRYSNDCIPNGKFEEW